MNSKPNLLFLLSDQHRGDWLPYDRAVKQRLGVETLHLQMPNLRAMMDRGTTFTCAVSPAPVCAPARACLAAGKQYRRCRVFTNQVNYDPVLQTFYSRLRESGYAVGGVGKFDLNKADLLWDAPGMGESLGFTSMQDSEGKMDGVHAAEKGIAGPYGTMLEREGWLERHVADMAQRGQGDHPTPLPDALYADNWVTQRGLDQLLGFPQDQPWFLQVNFSGPHDPWDVTQSMKDGMQGRVFPDAADCSFAKDNQGVRQNYAAMIENIDANIGKLIAAVAQRGELDNTLIVYSADHGELMGDHGLYGKQRPEQGSIHIPLVIDASHLGGAVGQANHSPVELQDLAATFLDYAGLAPDLGQDSLSLRPVLERTADAIRDFAVSELIQISPEGLFTSFAAVYDGTNKLILQPGKQARLYHLPSDPFECADRAAVDPAMVEQLKQAYAQHLRPRRLAQSLDF